MQFQHNVFFIDHFIIWINPINWIYLWLFAKFCKLVYFANLYIFSQMQPNVTSSTIFNTLIKGRLS